MSGQSVEIERAVERAGNAGEGLDEGAVEVKDGGVDHAGREAGQARIGDANSAPPTAGPLHLAVHLLFGGGFDMNFP